MPATIAAPSSPNAAITMSVLVGPGATALTRIPEAPSSTAQVRVRDSTAALVAP